MLKYQQAKDKILQIVSTLSPGQPLPPVRNLIKELGYSQVTLKRAFDELEAEGVLNREPGAGIFVAQQQADANCVGVLLPYLVPKMYSQILVGIQQTLVEAKLELMLLPAHYTDWQVIYEQIKNNHLTKLIINPSSADLFNIDFVNFMHKLADDGVDIVVIDLPVPGLKAHYIGFENSSAFAELTRKTVTGNTKKIAVVGKFDSQVYSSRLEGIRSVVNGNDIQLRQIDITDNSPQCIAEQIATEQVDAIMLCDAGSSVNLVYELRNLLGDNITAKIGGIVEQDERLPLPQAITLEKQNINLGQLAAEMLINQQEKPEVNLLPIKIIN